MTVLTSPELETIARGLGAIHLDVQVGLPQYREDAKVGDAAHLVHLVADLLGQLRQRFEIGATILTELTPLTPEIPSSMLSSMYWEKFEETPGNSLLNSVCTCSVNFSLVKPPWHSSNGFSGANNSTFENGEASLPSSGRPC